ncbi:hypothetical protein MBLNU459_g3788t1 [Dothideomycetes sp. NU459]
MATSFPPPPSTAIDWHQRGGIGFQVREVNGHIESTYTKSTGKWAAPAFVKDPYLRIHGMAPGLNYGQQCYEGLKAFRAPGDGAINIFRPSQNAARMQHSASFVSMPEVPTAHFERCVQLAVALNAEFVPPHDTGFAMYIRPLLFGSSAQLGLSPPDAYTLVVYVLPVGVYHGIHPVRALILEDFDRAAPEGTGSAKVGGNYAPVLRFSERARADGFGITLHLDSRTRSEIDEFSTSAFVGVLDGDGGKKVLVVPDSKNVIRSVTADSVCDIARSFGWTVEKRAIKYDELSTFVEVFAAGTAAALVPIKSITMQSRNDTFQYNGGSDEPGPVCVKLIETLQGIQRGKIDDTFGWLEKVGPAGPEYDGQAGSRAGDKTNGVGEGMIDALP